LFAIAPALRFLTFVGSSAQKYGSLAGVCGGHKSFSYLDVKRCKLIESKLFLELLGLGSAVGSLFWFFGLELVSPDGGCKWGMFRKLLVRVLGKCKCK
jgi:hypothetical protein